jgi:hypothetical protein
MQLPRCPHRVVNRPLTLRRKPWLAADEPWALWFRKVKLFSSTEDGRPAGRVQSCGTSQVPSCQISSG